MTEQPLLEEGTAIRTRSPQMDDGDFSERHCPAGSVGFIAMVLPDQECCYSVVFEPSGVSGLWSPAEIAQDAEILPPGHPDIPSRAVIRLSKLARDLVYDFGRDHETQTVTVPRKFVVSLLAAAEGMDAAREIAEVFPSVEAVFPDGAATARISFADVDRISAAAGYAERLCGEPEPSAAPGMF